MSIRLKLTLLLTAFVALGIAATSAWFVQAQRRQLEAASEEKLRLLADGAAQMGAEAALAKDPFMLVTYLNFLRKGNPEIMHSRVFLEGGWVDVGSPARPPTPEDAAYVHARDAGTDLKLELHFDAARVRRRKQEAVRRLSGEVTRMALAVVGLGALAAIFLGRSMTRRVERIQETMERAGEGGWGLHADVGGRDEIGRLARSFNAMSTQLAGLEERKRTFIASVTHELRSPLGAIEACVRDLVESERGLSAEARRNLDGIHTHAVSLSRFVGNLLEMSKIQKGKLDFEPTRGDLKRVLEDVALFFKPRAREAGLTLSCKVSPDVPVMSFDPRLVTQVLTNLVSNSIKFTSAPGEIQILAHRAGDVVECFVTDTGVGIDEASLQRIFQPFERVANSMHATGTGLGLAISKSIVEMHGGRIGVESAPGRGSRFWFTLPVSAKVTV